MKGIANVVTLSRIVASFLLIIVEPLSTVFLIIYIFCGVSDVLDGNIARKTKTVSLMGQVLDSVADGIFIFCTLFVFIPILELSTWMLCWIGGIAFIRMLSLMVGYKKYSSLCFLHTYANKLTGFLLFSFVFIYQLFGIVTATIMVCCIASFSATEELIINLTSEKLDRDIKFLST